MDESYFPEEKIHKLSRLHIDIGFGDYVPDNIVDMKLPSIVQLDSSVSWKVFPLEYIFAEKLQTFIQRGSGNSRSKDVFDLIFIYDKIDGDDRLVSAIKNVFMCRETKIPGSFVKYFKGIDKSFLKNSWASVEIKGDIISFDGIWIEFEKMLKLVDELCI